MNRRIAIYGASLASLLFAAGLTTASAKPMTLVTSLATLPAANSDVYPASASPLGKSYGDWSVAYWQWALGIPYASNPWANDSTGDFAGVNQGGPVWFLGGSLGDSFTRDFTVPAGKALFLPVHQWIFGATVFDCDPSVPGVPCDVPTLRASAASAADQATHLEVYVDGRAVNDLFDYRFTSPSSFSVTLPDGSVPTEFGAGLAAGTYGPHVSDGYYLILKKLSVGSHVIFVHVESDLGIVYDQTYNIDVVPQAVR